MPTMTKKTLLEWSATTIKPSIDLRSQYYYDTVRIDHGGDWLAFHDAWAGIYDHTLYASLIDLGEQYDKIAYQIHPHEFTKFETDIVALPRKTMFYVDLDLEKYGTWLRKESDRIGCKPRKDEYAIGVELCKKYDMHVINLTAIIDSETGFVAEYMKLCGKLTIKPVLHHATVLYENWKKHRVNNG